LVIVVTLHKTLQGGHAMNYFAICTAVKQ
jgi:hypothetical protein